VTCHVRGTRVPAGGVAGEFERGAPRLRASENPLDAGFENDDADALGGPLRTSRIRAP